ncbi:hypothetical protein [Paraburkholderia sp. CI3]|uniref:hypothetical protein n=1 Tax=Paraburkholderia sp. CI3 TaxID=2991060 RepID=UPI003D22B48A
MVTSDILLESRVAGTNVFFLGCFADRVTLYSQQVRALNLVDAILDEHNSILPPRGRVAIVGGGAGGMTAAAAFARSGFDAETIDVYERKYTLLHLQKGCSDRYLHPRLYDWPRPGWNERHAKLPIMTWTAGTADSVATSLESGFQVCIDKSAVRILKERDVTRIVSLMGGLYAVEINHHPPQDQMPYHVVILCVGFGYEKGIDAPGGRSYWDRFPLTGEIRDPTQKHQIFISGNGDGGLADLVLCAFIHMSHEELHDFALGYLNTTAMTEVRKILRQLDDQAWENEDIDLFTQYMHRLAPLLTENKTLMSEAAKRLRSDAEIWFGVREKYLFKCSTSLLNRFLAFLAILADREARDPRLIHLSTATSRPSRRTHFFDDGSVQLGDSERFTPRYQFRRFGPERVLNLEPFDDFRRVIKPDLTPLPPAAYPLTPELTDSAWRRFKYRDYNRRRIAPAQGKYDEKSVGTLSRLIYFDYDDPNTYTRMKWLGWKHDITQLSIDAAYYGVDDDPHLMDIRYWYGMYLACVGRLREGNLIYDHALNAFHRTVVDNKGELDIGLQHQLRGHTDGHQGEMDAVQRAFGKDSPRMLQPMICRACRMIAKNRTCDLSRAEELLNAIGTDVGQEAVSNPSLGIRFYLQRAKLCIRLANKEKTPEGRKNFANEALKFVRKGQNYPDALGTVDGHYLIVCELMARMHLGQADTDTFVHSQSVARQLLEHLPSGLAFCHFTADEMKMATGLSVGPLRLLSPDGG